MGGGGGPEEMSCSIRLMLMRPLASVRCNTSESHILLYTHRYASILLSCLKCAEMAEMRWWGRKSGCINAGRGFVCLCMLV